MTPNEIEEYVRRTIPEKQYPGKLLSSFALGLAGEGAEVLEAAMALVVQIKKVTEPVKKHLYHEKPLNVGDLAEELGDVIWYVVALAIVNNIRLEDILKLNKKKLEERYAKES